MAETTTGDNAAAAEAAAVTEGAAVAAAIETARTSAEVAAQAENVAEAAEEAAGQAASADASASEAVALDKQIIEILTLQGEQIAGMQVELAQLHVEHRRLHDMNEALLAEIEEPEDHVDEIDLPKEPEAEKNEPESRRKRRWI